ncbi:Dynein regulatory complex subunit 7 [Eumeta japonica]|uniref:Dynein regulatory complex subunit 7 n=1 Tax=Eumeta variegata TaxID=151549 RepID=A0A4C1TV46_EUMVA|nr:Dynein regulatory complex subunit 7 [Eumeta japonica]
MSPYTAIMRRSGNSFELAHVLVSWLAGAGYEAFVVHGYANRDTCLGVRYRLPCPHVPDETPVVEIEKPSGEEPRYKLTPLPDMRSKYLLYMDERKRQERQKALDEIEAEKQAKIAELERPPPDEVDGWRTHAWALVLPQRRGIQEPFFIEPSEGLRYPLSAPKYQRLHAIYNHENYYANLQDCSCGLDKISYDLCNSKRWEHLLPGEPFSRRQMAGVDYNDRASAVDTEKHLDMPASWVEKLELTADEYEQRYPGCYKIVNYKKVTHEKFSPYLQSDGVVEKIRIFRDYALATPIMAYEWYKHRADKMEYVKADYVKNEIVETFAIGRSDQFKKHVYDSKLPHLSIEGYRVIDFYYTGRIDRLAKIECGALTFNEYFKGRDDRS